jgi:hypothetical protein
VNRLSETQSTRAELVPFDPARHALEARIELAKERLFADLDEAQKQLRQVATTTVVRVSRNLTRALLVGGAVMLGIMSALVLRHQHKRLRVVWK